MVINLKYLLIWILTIIKYNMEDKIQINDGHYLELMDRLHVVMCTLNDHCLEHPLAESDEEIKFKIEYALGQLWDAYQMVGNKSPN
jgi:hypothetical protein